MRAYRSWLRDEAGDAIAEAWIDALLNGIDELAEFPERGRPRPDLGTALRTRVFRGSTTIAYAVGTKGVTVLGLFARGRNITAATVVADR